MKTWTQLTAVVSAAGILALVVAISPQAAKVSDEMPSGTYGVDILGITKNAGNLPEQQFSTH